MREKSQASLESTQLAENQLYDGIPTGLGGENLNQVAREDSPLCEIGTFKMKRAPLPG